MVDQQAETDLRDEPDGDFENPDKDKHGELESLESCCSVWAVADWASINSIGNRPHM